MQDQHETPPASPAPGHETPPTTPGDLRDRPTTWPTAIGVVGIVLASLGILGGVWSVVGWVFNNAFMGAMGGQMEEFHRAQRHFMPLAMTSSVLNTLVAALLLVGSVALLKRRPRARPLLLGWAGIRLIVAAFAAVVTILMQRAMFEAMMESSSTTPPAGMTNLIAAVTAVFTILWGWTPAVFVLVWMNRRSIRSEVATWHEGRDRAL